MKKLFKKMWELTFPPSEGDYKIKLRIYNFLIIVLVVFIVSYSSYYIGNSKNSVSVKPVIIPIQSVMMPSNIVSTNTNLPNDEFLIGELVGIKYWGIYGIVEDKILGVEGYKYEVRWKDNNKQLPKDEFYSWELFRPLNNTIPTSVLQN